MTDQKISREKIIFQTSIVGIAANGILAAGKIVFGVLAGSLAVLGDGLDSASDILTSFITLVTARVMAQPPDHDHPYGHGRAEVLGSKIVSFIVFFAGAQLFISSVKALASPGFRPLPEPVLFWVIGISIAVKLALAVYKLTMGRRIQSPLLIADGKNMAGDVIISGGVLAGLFISHWLKLPILDPIVALAVSVWILKVAVEIFMEGNEELMEGHGDSDRYASIFKAVLSVSGVSNPHRCRVRKIGPCLVVDMDIEVDGALTVTEGHDVACRVENAVKEANPQVYDVVIHVEPRGNVQEEKFGLSPESI